MKKLEFTRAIAEAFDTAKTIVHQRQRSTPAEFRARVQRLSVDFKAIENSEHWRNWPRSPTVFGKYHRAGDCALHVGFMFAQCVFAATQFAKLQTVGMPKDLNELTNSQLSDWMTATTNELESTTLELSQWSPGEILRDAELLQRLIAKEYEEGSSELGVSLSDVGMALGFSECELTDFVSRFSRSKKITAPKLGKCPINGRAQLYRLFEILKNLNDFSPLSLFEKGRITKHLEAVQRPPVKSQK